MRKRWFEEPVAVWTLAVFGVSLLVGGCASSKEEAKGQPPVIEEPLPEAVSALWYVESSTNIREGRSAKSTKVGQLKAGQKVKAGFLMDDWYAVFDEGAGDLLEENALGYVHAPLLKTAGTEWGQIKHASKDMNIRQGRGTSSEVVGKLEAGKEVKVHLFKNNWYAVFDADQTVPLEMNAIGYVHAPLLEDQPPVEGE
jgi:uncharacterized protein YgiM (DUF1202 family)